MSINSIAQSLQSKLTAVKNETEHHIRLFMKDLDSMSFWREKNDDLETLHLLPSFRSYNNHEYISQYHIISMHHQGDEIMVVGMNEESFELCEVILSFIPTESQIHMIDLIVTDKYT